MTNEEIKNLLFLEVFCPEEASKRPSEEVYKQARKLLDDHAPLSMIFECIPDPEYRSKMIELAEELEKNGREE